MVQQQAQARFFGADGCNEKIAYRLHGKLSIYFLREINGFVVYGINFALYTASCTVKLKKTPIKQNHCKSIPTLSIDIKSGFGLHYSLVAIRITNLTILF